MFDPFGDFSTRGYLRNLRGDTDLRVVKASEHNFFEANIDDALNHLAGCEDVTYADFLEVHRILFCDYYPWAGQDRSQTMANSAVSKGNVLFSHPSSARLAVEHGLSMGNDSIIMVKKLGEVMGLFAYGHPFLDGNGRTMLLVHIELCHRAGFSIDWHKAKKSDYLVALSREIETPGKGILDRYLTQFKAPQVTRDQWGTAILAMNGLDGLDDDNQIEGDIDDPAVAEKYREIEAKRGYSYSELPSLAAQWNAMPGKAQVTGCIVAISDTEVIQDAGRGRHVVWNRKELKDQDLTKGETVTIHANHQLERPRSKNGLGR